MSWQSFLHKCGKEIGRPERWPTSGSLTQEQVDRAYVAMQSVLNYLPLQRLAASYSLGTKSETASLVNGYYKVSLPTDLVSSRDDLGLDHLVVDTKVFDMDQAIPLNSFFAQVGNKFQNTRTFFTFTRSGKNILFFAPGGSSKNLTFNYFKKPAKPSLSDVNNDSANWPLNELDSEAARQVVAAHASISNYDAESLRAHQLLANFYERGSVNA